MKSFTRIRFFVYGLVADIIIYLLFSTFQDRNFPNTLIEMKRLAEESARFRQEDIPPRLREKEKLFSVFKDLERQMSQMNFELDRDLYPDNIERSWTQLMMLLQVKIFENLWGKGIHLI